MKTEKVHISLVKEGDTIVCTDGIERTVNRKDIKTGFMGISLWGDSYRMGTLLVERVVY